MRNACRSCVGGSEGSGITACLLRRIWAKRGHRIDRRGRPSESLRKKQRAPRNGTDGLDRANLARHPHPGSQQDGGPLVHASV